MRSRYAAYAKGLHHYVMETTHPDSPHRQSSQEAWRRELGAFTARVRFAGLKILDAPDPQADEGFVTFQAILMENGTDVGFVERSHFLRVDGRWLYVKGV